MTAAVTLQAFDPFRSGKLVLYQVTYSTGWHGFEIVPFALLGIFGVRTPLDASAVNFANTFRAYMVVYLSR
jgi:hypothetical protein